MPFLTRATFDYRRARMAEMMRANGFDALAFTSPDFFQWATNFHVDVQTWERPIVVVVPLGGEPFALMNELSTNHLRGMRERGVMWVDDVTIYAEHPRLAARVPALLPDVRLVACLAQMRELRFVKCAEELAVHRDAGALSDWGQERYRENIRPGRRLQELDFAMAALISEEAARRFPGENAEIRCLTLSGPASASPHGDGMPTGATIEKGHGIVNICNVRLNGMMTENERTF